MDGHQSGEPQAGETLLDRREFIQRAALVALGASLAPLLGACDNAGTAPAATTPAALAAAPPATFTPVPSTATPPPQATSTLPKNTPTSAPAEPPAAATEPPAAPTATEPPEPSPTTAAPATAAALGPYGVALLASTDRAAGVPAVLDMLGFEARWLEGKSVALKANFNSADAPPASTHLHTLRALVQCLHDWGAAQITLLERSGQGDTRTVLRQRGVMDLAAEFGMKVVVLDDLPAADWVRVEGAHWDRGFLFPRAVQEADAVVQTCCLKTHRFGGHFTMSLKNSVGLVAKFDPKDGYNYMGELHASPDQRLMIAEINAAYNPALVLLDGVLAFVSGGPNIGEKVESGLILASRDRVALDAVGVAMLRHLGTTPEVSRGAIFDQPQIAHASALGLGAPDPSSVSLHPANDEASRNLAGTLRALLAA
jgi:uncharacterized protein (DUF362 family)